MGVGVGVERARCSAMRWVLGGSPRCSLTLTAPLTSCASAQAPLDLAQSVSLSLPFCGLFWRQDVEQQSRDAEDNWFDDESEGDDGLVEMQSY